MSVSLQRIQELAIQAMTTQDDRYHDELYSILIRTLPGYVVKTWGFRRDAAKEVAHNAIADAFQKLRDRTYDPDKPGNAKFLTLVYNILRKRVIDLFRTGLPPIEPLQEGDDERIIWPFLNDDHNDVTIEEIEALYDCLYATETPDSLTSDERTVVILQAQNVTFSEAARRIRKSMWKARAAYERGIEKLRRCMAKKGHR